MCMIEYVAKIMAPIYTWNDSWSNRLNPHNTGEGKWNSHCVTCIPLVEKAELAEAECPTSAKIRMILKLLQDIDDRSDGEEKTIIFSQFTSMLDLIAPFLKEKGIRFVRCGSGCYCDQGRGLNQLTISC